MNKIQKNALISVFKKDGVVEFAQALIALGWKIFASGGTAKALIAAGIPVTDVAELVGGAAILGHRVVTLSREVHAGLLATSSDLDIAELEALGIPRLDLVYNNLYPLAAAIAKPDATMESVIESTDIGGPTLLRSAAKGRRIVISDPNDQQLVLDLLKAGEVPEAVLTHLAAKAEGIVANYVLMSARFLSDGKIDGVIGTLALECKYGENAHQAPAGLFSTGGDDPLALDKFEMVQGTAPSYVNVTDLDRLLQTLTHIAAGWWKNFGNIPRIAVAVKHGNACGVGVSTTNPARALQRMIDGDRRAIMGAFVITNFGLNAELSEHLRTYGMEKGKRRIYDGIVAPEVTDDAMDALKRKDDKCRLLVNRALATEACRQLDTSPRFRHVRGGFLVQPNYTAVLNLDAVENAGELSIQQKADLILAWAICATSNSNTITLVKDGQLLGNGVGQQDRVTAAEVAVKRACDAGHDTKDAVACSDSFFPFPDGPIVLADAGIKVIFATSGSEKDGLTIAACKERGVTLCLIPDSIGRMFFNH